MHLWLDELEDRTLLTTFTVTSADGGMGTGTLWNTIAQADADTANPSVPDVINFAIPGTDVQTITLTEALPIITRPLIIDGTSQPGYLPGNGITLCRPVIELNGSQAGEADGLEIDVGDCRIEGLIINSFRFAGILVNETNNPLPVGHNVIQGNFIGTDATGLAARGNGVDGIDIVDSPDNTIGGTTASAGNLISGNTESGISIVDDTSTANHVEGNFIGTDVNGTHALGNALDGVFFGQLVTPFVGTGYASNNVVGGTDSGTRNIISGNGWNGVHIDSGDGNQVQGNYIGLDVNGTAPVPNHQDGVLIEDGINNLVGGTADNAGNAISANVRNGVEIVSLAVTEDGYMIPPSSQGSYTNQIQGNDIGTDASGTFTDLDGQPESGDELGNQQDGVLLKNASTDTSVVMLGNVIGGADEDDGAADGNVKARNIIAGNFNDGIEIEGPGIQKTLVEGNYIGTNKAGTTALPNDHFGIVLNSLAGQAAGPFSNSIGGTSAGAGNLISGNGIANLPDGLPTGGVWLANGSNGNVVSNNHIGTDTSFLNPLPNVGNGLTIDNAVNNTIGGDVAGAENIVSANTGDGVVIEGSNATNNKVQLNLIGVGGDTVTPLGNKNGVTITNGASGNVIGGIATNGGQEISLGNVIAANSGVGVEIDDGATKTQVAGNFIGTNSLGAILEGNGTGVNIADAPNNTIGGTTAAARNVIVNSIDAGVRISDSNGSSGSGNPVTAGNVVEGNFIGMGVDGITSRANGASGVEIDFAPSNTIGGTIAGAGNVISGNKLDGVLIQGIAATSDVVAGNDVGTTANGLSPAPNGASQSSDPTMASGVVITAARR